MTMTLEQCVACCYDCGDGEMAESLEAAIKERNEMRSAISLHAEHVHRAEAAESELAALKQRMAKLADDLEQKNGTKVFCHIAKLIRRRMQGQP